MDNGPALKSGNSSRLQTAGDLIGDVFEISRIRSEDFDQHRGEAVGDDVKQANNQPSSRTPRGHQGRCNSYIIRTCYILLHNPLGALNKLERNRTKNRSMLLIRTLFCSRTSRIPDPCFRLGQKWNRKRQTTEV